MDAIGTQWRAEREGGMLVTCRCPATAPAIGAKISLFPQKSIYQITVCTVYRDAVETYGLGRCRGTTETLDHRYDLRIAWYGQCSVEHGLTRRRQ